MPNAPASAVSDASLRRSRDLRRRRVALDLTQAELAEHLDVRASTIFRWERGDRPVPAYVIRAMRDLERELGAATPSKAPSSSKGAVAPSTSSSSSKGR